MCRNASLSVAMLSDASEAELVWEGVSGEVALAGSLVVVRTSFVPKFRPIGT